MKTTGNASAASTPEPSTRQQDAERLYLTLAQIPRGRLCSYGSVAALAGLPGRARWVGRMLGQLPENSELPWFRVVNASGRISFPEGSANHHRQLSHLIAEGSAEPDGRVHWRRCRWP